MEDLPFAKWALNITIKPYLISFKFVNLKLGLRRYGQVVRQWIANPLSPVRIWVSP